MMALSLGEGTGLKWCQDATLKSSFLTSPNAVMIEMKYFPIKNFSLPPDIVSTSSEEL